MDIENLRATETGELLGTVTIFGIAHHFNAIRVTEKDGNQVAMIEANDERLDELYRLYPYRMQTVEIPRHNGDWLVYIHPHGA